MLVSQLKENSKEQKAFRGEIAEKVFLCEGVCRVLLIDSKGDLVYCLLQGCGWFSKIKDLNIGQKIILAPSKIVQVPKRHKKFYTPEIKGKTVSDLFFNYDKHDFELGITVDESKKLFIDGFNSLKTVSEELRVADKLRGSVIGILVDFYIKPNTSSKSIENFYRIKLIDDTLEASSCVQLNLFLRKLCSLKRISIGDIIVAQGVNFRVKQSQVVGVHNSSSSGFAVLSWVNCKIEFSANSFDLTENIMAAVCHLQNWILTTLQYQSLMIQLNKPAPPSYIHDLVLYLVQIHHNFPDQNQSTLVFADPFKLVYMTADSSLISHISSFNWVKLSQIRVFKQKVELNENSSLVILPDWTPVVKSFPPISQTTLKEVINEYSKLIGKDLYVTINHKHTQMPCMQAYSLLDPLNEEEFARIKALVIDFHPRIAGLGVFTKRERLEYIGLMKLYSDNEVISVYYSGQNSRVFYGLNDYDGYNEVVRKVVKVQNYLLKGYGWIEIGIKRYIQNNQVILVLSETEIKIYD